MDLDGSIYNPIAAKVSLIVKRWWRYGGLFLISFGLVCSLAVSTPAQSLITWEDLQPPSSTTLHNPYVDLSTEQTYDLATLVRLNAWVQENQASADSLEAREANRLEQHLQQQGLDVGALLSQVDQARQYWQQKSQGINPDIVNQSVRLSGYALPLSRNDAQRVTEFLLVPYVGACIHVPPPPPNQMLYIRPPKAIDPPGLFAPITVEGQLNQQSANYELFRVDGSLQVDVNYSLTLTHLDLSSVAAPLSAPFASGPWWQTIQVRISAVLTQSIGNLDRQRTLTTFFVGLLISFSYGILHTLGPGHGKTVIISYFVGQGGSLRRGIVMGVQIAVFHVLSAIIVVILADQVIRQVSGSAPGHFQILQLISYGAISTIGGWMLWQAIFSLKQLPKRDPSPKYLGANASELILYPSLTQQALQPKLSSQTLTQPASHLVSADSADCLCITCKEPKRAGDWLSVAVGAVPCSGALLILFYGLANDLLWPSIAMVIAISLGMAITLAWIGMMAILGRQYTSRRLGQRWQPSPRMHQVTKIIGASLVSLIGLGLFSMTLATIIL